jgi:hypothetical protein
MTHFGSPDDWCDFIESQIPQILELVIGTWEAMPPPAGNELEDTVSESLCRALRQSRNRCDLPFRIDTQLVELDPEAGEDQGRMDIVFSPPVPREDIYFCLECKRLNVRDLTGGLPRPYYVEYVKFGMLRFVRAQYAKSVRFGGMLAFVLNGDIPAAISGVEDNIIRMHVQLAMNVPASFQSSSVRPADMRVRETIHTRAAQAVPFVIQHLFMAGDPQAPLRDKVVPASDKPVKAKKPDKRKLA